MTPRALFEAIGLVDDALVLEADETAVRRAPVLTVLRRYAPLAACLCVFAGAVLVWRSDFGRMGSAASGAAMDATAMEDTADAGADMAADDAADVTAAAGEADAGAAQSNAYAGAPDVLPDAPAEETQDGTAAGSYYCLLAPSLPPSLTGALTAGDGGGSYALMASSILPTPSATRSQRRCPSTEARWRTTPCTRARCAPLWARCWRGWTWMPRWPTTPHWP